MIIKTSGGLIEVYGVTTKEFKEEMKKEGLDISSSHDMQKLLDIKKYKINIDDIIDIG